MSIVRALASLATASVLALAPSAAFAASSDDYTIVSPPTAPTVKPQHHPSVLPNTGADASTMVLGAAGALLLVGGSGVVIVSRRRRTEHA
jgi:LPXTG-motif cell wall-anchored protein